MWMLRICIFVFFSFITLFKSAPLSEEYHIAFQCTLEGDIDCGYGKFEDIVNIYLIKYKELFNEMGDLGEFEEGEMLVKSLHNLAILHLIHGKFKLSKDLHNQAVSLNPSKSVLPPLAVEHLNGQLFGGFGDIFYMGAIIKKQLVDSYSDKEIEEWEFGNEVNDGLMEYSQQMSVLLGDSGAWELSDVHLKLILKSLLKEISLNLNSFQEEYQTLINLEHENEDTSSSSSIDILDHLNKNSPYFHQFLSNYYHYLMNIPIIYSNQTHIQTLTQLTFKRLQELLEYLQPLDPLSKLSSSSLNNDVNLHHRLPITEYSFSTGFYFAYLIEEPHLFPPFMNLKNKLNMILHSKSLSQIDYNKLRDMISHHEEEEEEEERMIHVGFVSHYLRKHSICKLWCSFLFDLATQSSENDIKISIFSSTEQVYKICFNCQCKV